LVVDWKKNLSRNGEEPTVDEALNELALGMLPKKGQGDSEDGSSGQLNPILTRPLPDRRLEVIGGFRRIGDILGGMSGDSLIELGRPSATRSIGDRPCDGCGDPDPSVDLWAEDSETGEQLWLCAACDE
jgi:hypothetical protein